MKLYYCGGGMSDVGSVHGPHPSPQFKGPPRQCCGDPRLMPTPLGRIMKIRQLCEETGGPDASIMWSEVLAILDE